MTPDIRLIFPKKGRLNDALREKFENASIKIEKANDRCDFGTLQIDEAGIAEVLLQKDCDALENLTLGLADIAIVGKDKFIEYKCRMAAEGRRCALSLCNEFKDVARCRLQIAAPFEIKRPQELSGLRIVTSYPQTLRMWLQSENVENVEIITRDGGVEDYVRLGIADAVCDVVQTGESLRANSLTPSMTLLESAAVLISAQNADSGAARWAKAIADKMKNADIDTAQTKTPALTFV